MKGKSTLILILFILCGIVLGGLIGELAASVDWLSWLSYGQEFGLSTPVNLDLQVINITFGLMFSNIFIQIYALINYVLSIKIKLGQILLGAIYLRKD